jgi:UMF1 family MFS transporter
VSAILNKRTLSWAFYDWANSAYTTIVVTSFFPILFGNYWFVGSGSENTTTPLGIANAVGSLTVVLLAPVLGAIADRGGLKKRFLLLFLLLGVLFVSTLSFIGQGDWQLAITIYVLSFIGFTGANVFYDSMLVDISEQEKFDLVSALGFSLGYLGGGIALLGCILFANPASLGFDKVTPVEQIILIFLFTGIWWAVFSLPLLMNVKERKPEVALQLGTAIRQGLIQLAHTFREIRKLKVVFTFLLAYWLYIDGVDTIIAMAADYGRRIGFNQNDLFMAFLITQFVGFPAAIIYGKFGEMIGAKSALLIAIATYIGVTVYGYFMDEVRDFYILAIIVGLVMGGIQSLSRAFFARIIPKNKSAEFFGFYNMIGKLAAVLGPLLMAMVSQLTGNPRLSILSIIVLFIAGGLILLMVDEQEGMAKAREMEEQI